MKWLFLCITILAATALNGQLLEEDFSDGDFINSPAWIGDISSFKVNESGLLQLAASDAGSSLLLTPISLSDSINFTFYVKTDFAPSSKNQVKMVLWASDSDLTKGRNIVLRLGESGSSDAWYLESRENGSTVYSEKLDGKAFGSGVSGIMDVTIIGPKVQVSYINDSGKESLGTVTLPSPFTFGEGYFGWQCSYTKTRIDRFFLDDIVIENADDIVEEFALIKHQQDLSGQIELTFSLPVGTVANNQFVLLPDDIAPVKIEKRGDRTLILDFGTTFQQNKTYELVTKNLEARTGQQLGEVRFDFEFVDDMGSKDIEPYNVLITELMIDPTPVVGLPDSEYIELYNATDSVISLSTLAFQRGSKIYDLPEKLLEPKGYVVVVPEKNKTLFSNSSIIPLASFPALTNSGLTLSLIEKATGTPIHSVTYTKDSYQDKSKDDGGFSLSMIDVTSACIFNQNFAAAQEAIGGSPGESNTFPDDFLMVDELAITSVSLENERRASIRIDRYISDEAISQLSYVGDLGASTGVSISRGNALNEIIMTWDKALEEGKIYDCKIQGSFEDCAYVYDNWSSDFQLAIPGAISEGDLVISEVLFRPEKDQYDFVEIYNNSDKALSLDGLFIDNRRGGVLRSKEIKTLSLAFPNKYYVLTKDKDALQDLYDVKFPDQVVEMSLPTLHADYGEVLLYAVDSTGERLLDRLEYTEKQHNYAIKVDKGVSLEKDFQNGTWHSASSLSGFATPTYENSIAPSSSNVDFEWTFGSEVFGPNSEIEQKELIIDYNTTIPDGICNVRIFNTAGRMVRYLVNNQTLGSHGQMVWDGLEEDKTQVSSGIYILHIQIIGQDGRIFKDRKTCVVAR